MNQYLPSLPSLPSIKALKLYGVPKSQLLHTMLTLQSISSDIESTCLDEYYLLYSSPEHFLKNSHCGIYYRNDSQYIIIFDKSSSRGQILAAVGKSIQLSLSFRTPRKEYNLPSYVYVTLHSSSSSSSAQFNLL